MNWATIIATFFAAILGGGGTAAIVNALARRKVTNIEAAERLNDSTLEWAEAVKADARTDVAEARREAAEARKEAAEARREATEVRREMHAIKVEAEELTSYLTQVVRWIQSPDMSMERLRTLVSQSGPLNGQAKRQRWSRPPPTCPGGRTGSARHPTIRQNTTWWPIPNSAPGQPGQLSHESDLPSASGCPSPHVAGSAPGSSHQPDLCVITEE